MIIQTKQEAHKIAAGLHHENTPIKEVPELSVPQTRPKIPAAATGNYNNNPDYVPEEEAEQRVDFALEAIAIFNRFTAME